MYFIYRFSKDAIVKHLQTVLQGPQCGRLLIQVKNPEALGSSMTPVGCGGLIADAI